jgi:hypothetical protein
MRSHLYEVDPLLFRFPPSIPGSLHRTQKETIEPLCPLRRPPEEVSFERFPSAVVAKDSFPRQNDHACPQLRQPVHAKAGSRWPEPRDGRCAVVSLLFSLAQDLDPA